MAPMKVVTKPPSSNGGVTDEKPNNAVDSTNYVLKNLTMLSVWYAGTVMYNIENKKALNMCPLPKTIATMQMLLGMPYFLSRWMAGLKAMPTIHVSEEGIQRESPKGGIVERIKHKVKNGLCRVGNAVQAYSSMLRQSVLIAMIHMLSVTALGAGGISFVHIVKSSEPLFVSALALFTGMESMSPVTYATLVPILTGVALASVKDVNFSRLALVTSLASNVCATVRRIEVKKFFDQDLDKIGRNLDVMNVSSLVTIFSSLMLAPIALMEAPQWASAYRSVVYKFGHAGLMKLVRHIALSGFFYTLTNEVSFFALSQLTPVSHAVANTLKRVFLIFGSSMFFQTKITRLGHLGSAMAIVGAMLYSLSKHYGG
ncbi:phosphoenolpyruvate/phosphate translocator, putative [Babesia caballi]|uniref:Phosphoenolpyruvate/phosphate translocator, putative n=1 Tax=Babesia caballi TaxID=5871 RepID=A0AAV4LUT0_BABCB|nr:phosphoenolpyruvate/phosphate translocator, putative [Babesia caballi]